MRSTLSLLFLLFFLRSALAQPGHFAGDRGCYGPSIDQITANAPVICPGESSQLNVIATSPDPNYCVPSVLGGCSFSCTAFRGGGNGWDRITDVSLAGVVRTGHQCDDLSGANGYSEFAEPVGALVAGSTGNPYEVIAEGNDCWDLGNVAEGVAAWIDFNQDNFLSANENIFNGLAAQTPSVYTGTFDVPANAVNGPTRMRVRCIRLTNPGAYGACDAANEGETEDYTVIISGGIPPLTYSWIPATGMDDPTSATPLVSIITSTTTYTVTVTTGSGCPSSAEVTVNMDPTDSDGDNIVDCDDVCVGTFGTVGTQCDDSDPHTLNDVITAQCVCTGTPCDPPVIGSISNSGPSCGDFSIDLNVSATGTGDLTYAWSGPNYIENPAAASTQTIVFDNGSYTYTVIVTDDCGSTEATTTVDFANPPTGGFSYSYTGGPSNFCTNSGTVSIGQVFNWTPGGTFSASPAGLVVDPVSGAVNTAASTPGSYVVTYTIAADVCPEFTTGASFFLQVPSVWYPDQDGDGYGDAGAAGQTSCAPLQFQVTNNDDECAFDPNKIAPGLCGCGVSDADSDGDGTADCTDGCPNDPGKIAPGQCGCGSADTDADIDGTADCVDPCPSVANVVPGDSCNDNNALTINDQFGANCLCAGTAVSCVVNGDCNDNNACTSDACASNACVYTPLPDTDGDGTCNAQDGCPNDPGKIAPGLCGCGVSDADTDGDGLADCNDGCPLLGGTVGDPCNDNDPLTLNDAITAACVCAGTLCDPPVIDAISNGGPSCGVFNIALNVSATGTGDLTYAWSGPNYIENAAAASTQTIVLDNGSYTYTVTVTDDCGSTEGTTTVDFANPPTGGFSYSYTGGPSNFCTNSGTMSIGQVFNWTPGGTFSASPAGLVVDPVSGAVNTTASTPGSYVVTYTIAAGVCPEFTTGASFFLQVPSVWYPDQDGDGYGDAGAPGQTSCAPLQFQVTNNDDECAFDPNKIAPGLCGCGVSDADSDGDGTADCTDGCPDDPGKVAPGQCGCGSADTDADSDGTADCVDPCPSVANVVPGDPCNDNNVLTINDQYGTNCTCAGTVVSCVVNGDCEDNDTCTSDACEGNTCVYTPLPDTDGDGTCDAQDGCPDDPGKIAPGLCGCGVSDDDQDADGIADCNDGCPQDPDKIEPGVCGCGVSDVDTDGDSVEDCNDGCPEDAAKIGPGLCGCGSPEPGAACDDGDDTTINDVVSADCVCAGEVTTTVPVLSATPATIRYDRADRIITISRSEAGPVLLFDATGRLIATAVGRNVRFDLGSASPGVYVLRAADLAQRVLVD